MGDEAAGLPQRESNGQFPTTRWSVVTLAGDTRSLDAQAALGSLYQAYWHPLYSFARRSGSAPHDAQDLVQGLFADLLERNWLQNVGQERSRFRSFIA